MSLLHLTFLCYIQNLLSLNIIPCSDLLESKFVETYHKCLSIISSAKKLDYLEKKEHKYALHFHYKKLYNLYRKWGEHNIMFARVLDEIRLNSIPEIKKMLNHF